MTIWAARQASGVSRKVGNGGLRRCGFLRNITLDGACATPGATGTIAAARAFYCAEINPWSKTMTRAIILALAAVAALSACNTVKGAGKDIQSGGAAITDEAQDAQKKM